MNSNVANMHQTTQSTNNSGRGRGRGGRNTGRGGRGHGCTTRAPRVMRYCYTCGWCTHDGAHCRFPTEGHKPNATIDNHMGGSMERLPPNYGSE